MNDVARWHTGITGVSFFSFFFFNIVWRGPHGYVNTFAAGVCAADLQVLKFFPLPILQPLIRRPPGTGFWAASHRPAVRLLILKTFNKTPNHFLYLGYHISVGNNNSMQRRRGKKDFRVYHSSLEYLASSALTLLRQN